MKEIRKINALSLAKISAGFYGIIGFFVSVGAAISSMTNIVAQSTFEGSYIMVTFFNLGVGILLGLVVALVTGFLGWVLGYISASLYNMFARRMGGIKLSLRDVEFKKK